MKKLNLSALALIVIFSAQSRAEMAVKAFGGFSFRDGAESAHNPAQWGGEFSYSFGDKPGTFGLSLGTWINPLGVNDYTGDGLGVFKDAYQFHLVYLAANYQVTGYLSLGVVTGVSIEKWRQNQSFANAYTKGNSPTLGARLSFEWPIHEKFSIGSETHFTWFMNSNFDGVQYTNLLFGEVKF